MGAGLRVLVFAAAAPAQRASIAHTDKRWNGLQIGVLVGPRHRLCVVPSILLMGRAQKSGPPVTGRPADSVAITTCVVRRLFLAVAAAELVYLASGVEHFLLTGIERVAFSAHLDRHCLLYTSPSPRDRG